jgi:hypothetical protein
MVMPGGGAFSYERGTPVGHLGSSSAQHARTLDVVVQKSPASVGICGAVLNIVQPPLTFLCPLDEPPRWSLMRYRGT